MKTKKDGWEIGEKYFIRTVTYHYTGQLKVILPDMIVLSDAAWIADSGRFSGALKMGTLNEVEPYPGEVMISRAVIVDVSVWAHELPRSQK